MTTTIRTTSTPPGRPCCPAGADPGPAGPGQRWPVADCERAVAFYVSALAATELARRSCRCGRLVAVTVDLAGRRIELVHDPAGAAPEFGLLTLEAPDPDALLRQVVAAGGTIEIAFPRRPGRPGRTSILDPTGRRWRVRRPLVPPQPGP